MSQNFENGNQKTVEAYDFAWGQYIGQDLTTLYDTLQERYDEIDRIEEYSYQRDLDEDALQERYNEIDRLEKYFDELDWLVRGVSKAASILEIGSGTGDDALYFQSMGYRIDCSEAALSAISLLEARGLPAQKLNVLTDDIAHTYQLILALGVVVHFSPQELQLVSDKVFKALDVSGRFSFTTVEGQIEKWYSDAFDRTRYVSHLPEPDVRAILRQSGFNKIETKISPINDEVNGLLMVAMK